MLPHPFGGKHIKLRIAEVSRRYRLKCQVFLERISKRPQKKKKRKRSESTQGAHSASHAAEKDPGATAAAQPSRPRQGKPGQAESPARSSKRHRRCARACA